MITINVGHLYPNELNLYGENGNIKALKYALEKYSVQVNVTNINESDPIDFNQYDFLYIGSGRPIFLRKAKERLKIYKEEILNYLNQDKFFLITGNALSIFDFLGLYEVLIPDSRIVADIIGTSSLCNGMIRGFQNTEYLIKNLNNIIFNLDNPNGNDFSPFEGFKYHNLYVTSLIGPLLARNPNLTEYFAKKLREQKKTSNYLNY